MHDPNTGLMFQARRGAGAFCGERRLAVAAHPLDGASNVCVRAPVSPALDLVVDDRATVWDIAAGATIMVEAGGCLTALDGAPLLPLDMARAHDDAIPFVAGNGHAHREAVAALRRQLLTPPARVRAGWAC